MRRMAYASDMNLAERELSRGNVRRALELLNRHRPENFPASLTDKEDLRGWEWRYLWQFCQEDPHEVLLDVGNSPVWRLSVSDTGRYLAVTTTPPSGSRIYVRDLIQNVAVMDFPGRHATFSPTEPLLAYWSEDPDSAHEGAGSFRLWDATSRRITNNRLLPMADGVHGVAFSSDGTTLAVSTTGWNKLLPNELILLNVQDGKQIKTLDAPQIGPGAGYPFALAGDLSIAVHGSGTARESFARVVDLNTGEEIWRTKPARTGEWIECLALSSDKKLLAVGHGLAKPTLQIWDVDKRTQVSAARRARRLRARRGLHGESATGFFRRRPNGSEMGSQRRVPNRRTACSTST